MRRFPSTPEKKSIGMFILFALIPLFIAWYWIFFLDHKPDSNTLIILGVFALLIGYIYYKYREKVEALLFGAKPEPAEDPVEEPVEDDGEQSLDEELSERLDEELEK